MKKKIIHKKYPSFFLCLFFFIFQNSLQAQNHFLLISTYTDTIHVYSFNPLNGKLSFTSAYVGNKNPSYLAINKEANKIYATQENEYGSVHILQFDRKNKKLHLVDSIKSGGAHPCYVALNKNKNLLAVSNYSGGNWSLIPLSKNGKFKDSVFTFNEYGQGKFPQQNASHVHCSEFHLNGKFITTLNLGTDKINTYHITQNEKKQITINLFQEHKQTSGDGPRHIIFHKKLARAYAINEISGSVNVFKIKNNELILIQSIASDTTQAEKKSSADIHISNDNKFLYTSNRISSNELHIYKIKTDGMLESIGIVGTKEHPRNFILSGDDKWLIVAAKNADCIEIFKRDKASGLLQKMPNEITIKQPVCLKWLD